MHNCFEGGERALIVRKEEQQPPALYSECTRGAGILLFEHKCFGSPTRKSQSSGRRRDGVTKSWRYHRQSCFSSVEMETSFSLTFGCTRQVCFVWCALSLGFLPLTILFSFISRSKRRRDVEMCENIGRNTSGTMWGVSVCPAFRRCRSPGRVGRRGRLSADDGVHPTHR